MSPRLLVAPATRLVAMPPIIWGTYTRATWFPERRSGSRAYMSPRLLVAPATRLVAMLTKAIQRPSGVMAGESEAPLPLVAPSLLTLTRVVVLFWRSRTKMSVALLVSLATRSPAALTKARYRPSGLISGLVEAPLPPAPALLTL